MPEVGEAERVGCSRGRGIAAVLAAASGSVREVYMYSGEGCAAAPPVVRELYMYSGEGTRLPFLSANMRYTCLYSGKRFRGWLLPGLHTWSMHV